MHKTAGGLAKDMHSKCEMDGDQHWRRHLDVMCTSLFPASLELTGPWAHFKSVFLGTAIRPVTFKLGGTGSHPVSNQSLEVLQTHAHTHTHTHSHSYTLQGDTHTQNTRAMCCSRAVYVLIAPSLSAANTFLLATHKKGRRKPGLSFEVVLGFRSSLAVPIKSVLLTKVPGPSFRRHSFTV